MLLITVFTIMASYKYSFCAMHDPERYENFKSFAARDASIFTPRLVNETMWKPKQLILDYGCGAGSTGYKYILPSVIQNEGKLYSVDGSKDMIEFAKREYSHFLITYEVGDILGEFPFKKMEFDKIFSVYVFHFIKDYRGALQKLYEILKPGGSLGITVPASVAVLRELGALGSSDKWKDIMGNYMKDYVPEWVKTGESVDQSFSSALEKVGYKIDTIELHNLTWKFSSDEFIEFFLSVNPYIKQIPGNRMEELRMDYRRIMENNYDLKDSDGKFLFKYQCLYLIATK